MRTGRSRWLASAAALVVFALAGCGPTKLERDRALFQQPLASLADSGQVEAMRVVADIEVLRASGVFSDSLASALTAMRASQYIALDDQGRLARTGVGGDLTTLVDYAAAEPLLLKEQVITSMQAAELRRMALDNIAAAAEMATNFKAKLPAATPN